MNEDNIKMNLKEIRFRLLDWNYLPQDTVQRLTVVNMVINVFVP
jgi:hypothetical protein